ncbi:unnamed protein product, partial [Ectocarpus fasciculatus]
AFRNPPKNTQNSMRYIPRARYRGKHQRNGPTERWIRVSIKHSMCKRYFRWGHGVQGEKRVRCSGKYSRQSNAKYQEVVKSPQRAYSLRVIDVFVFMPHGTFIRSQSPRILCDIDV